MGLFSRRGAPAPPGEARSIRLAQALLGLGGSTYADIRIDTAESSLQSIAVRATVDLIASLGSELPVDVYSGDGPDRRRRPTPGYLLDPSGDGHGLADWSYQVLRRGCCAGTCTAKSSTGAAGIHDAGHVVQPRRRVGLGRRRRFGDVGGVWEAG
jgi:hypothetical protein